MPFTLQDLINAGLPATSTDGNDEFAATQFSRELTAAEWQTYLTIANPREASKLQAAIDAKNIPNWATWTQAQWATWRDNNISDAQINAVANLAEAKAMLLLFKTVLDSNAQMTIAIRDYILLIQPD